MLFFICNSGLNFTGRHLSTAATAEMPDAMEIIYQKALALGKAGCVSNSITYLPCCDIKDHSFHS